MIKISTTDQHPGCFDVDGFVCVDEFGNFLFGSHVFDSRDDAEYWANVEKEHQND